jgi:hypothetical protein
MRSSIKWLFQSIIIFCFANLPAQNTVPTEVSIKGNQFYINGELTYKGRYWEGHKIEGLLFNSRMVQGIFDDLNPETKVRFSYPDTKKWDPERNTSEFVAAMDDWKKHGLLGFTLNLQGGSPLGYGNMGWINSTFDEEGNPRPEYLSRLERILRRADKLRMVVILGYFYFGQDQYLKNEKAVIHAVDTMTHWILNKGFKNILVEINNECDIRYDHEILQPKRIQELIERVKGTTGHGHRLLVGTSYGGGTIPLPNVVTASDFILLHGNGVEDPEKISEMVQATREVRGYTDKPILFNEDDHYNFTAENYNLKSAVKAYASWGYFDFRRKGEGFENGYQSVPVDWGITSERKRSFFKKIKEITGF